MAIESKVRGSLPLIHKPQARSLGFQVRGLTFSDLGLRLYIFVKYAVGAMVHMHGS